MLFTTEFSVFQHRPSLPGKQVTQGCPALTQTQRMQAMTMMNKQTGKPCQIQVTQVDIKVVQGSLLLYHYYYYYKYIFRILLLLFIINILFLL